MVVESIDSQLESFDNVWLQNKVVASFNSVEDINFSDFAAVKTDILD
jgi:hypothetical protein